MNEKKRSERVADFIDSHPEIVLVGAYVVGFAAAFFITKKVVKKAQLREAMFVEQALSRGDMLIPSQFGGYITIPSTDV